MHNRTLRMLSHEGIPTFLPLVAAILLLAIPAVSCSKSAGTGPPNIVLLFADDLGYGDLGCYGHPTILTPNLDRMAEEGIRLTSFYAAAPSCTPSRVALLTGRYPLRAGLPRVLGPDATDGIAESEVTLAEALKELGYRTKAIGKWHLGHSQPGFLPTANGFDSYFGLLYSNDMMPPWVQTEKPLELYRDDRPIEYPVDQSTLTTRYSEDALNFIRESSASRQPFFLYLAYTMVHVPLHADPDFRGRSRAGLFGDVVETIDWSAGAILRALEEEGLDQNTIVIFTSDNGPWLNMPDRMFSEGFVKPWDAGSPGLLRGYKGNTYEGGMRVPCIVRWPGRIPGGGVSAELATTMDILPTVLHWTGGRLPENVTIDGENVARLLEGQSPAGEHTFFYLRGSTVEAVRNGKWKLRLSAHVRDDIPEGTDPTPELFDLDVDPSERYNRAEEYPETVRVLAAEMVSFAGEIGADLSGAASRLAQP